MVAVERARPAPPRFRVIRGGQPAPGEAVFAPRGAARDLMLAKDREVLIEGPAGTGKSRVAMEKAYLLAHRYPGMRGLFVRQTRASMTDSTLVTWEEKVVPPGSPLLDGPKRTQRHSYMFPNRSEIVIAGLDKSSKIMSTEYDFVLVDEATETAEGAIEDLTTRLRNFVMPYQQLVASVNPGPPSHWLNQRANRGAMRRLRSRHRDNPRLFNARTGRWTAEGTLYMATLDALTGVRKLRLRDGIWAMADGMVYDGWDPERHLVNSFAIPPSWRRFRVIDFGYTNAFVCQWWALDDDSRMYRYREIYRTQRLAEDHAREIVALSAGERIELTIADHDAEDRATLAAHGVPTRPAFKSVSRGIQATQARLRPAGDGRPRLYLLRDALVARDPDLAARKLPTCTEEEVEGYVWAQGAGGKAKEEPVKLHDHGVDTLRYAVAYADGLGPHLLAVAVQGSSSEYTG